MWQPGHVILDEYEVVKQLGVGGMATVYLVRQIGQGLRFAAKVPHSHLILTTQDRLTFAREVQFWISLPEHPHIVQCYFVREADGVPVVFAEYVPSGTLSGWCARERIHGVAHVLDLGIQLSEAIGVAHKLGVVHRDVKPANCLIDDSGLLKIGDFGLAAAREEVFRRRVSASAAGKPRGGTPAYCSPEQFDGRPVDGRTDIWSFGVTLLELLTSRRPLIGPAARHCAEAFRTTPVGESIPASVWEFLFKLLDPDVARRLSSFADVSVELKELYRAITSRPYPRRSTAATPAGPPPPTRRRTRRHVARALLARALKQTGRDPSEAEQASVSAPVGYRPQSADALAEIALLNEAAQVYRQAISEKRSPHLIAELCSALHLTAVAQKRLGNLRDAIAAYQEAIDHLRLMLPNSDDRRIPVALAEAVTNQAICYRQQGDLDSAIRGYSHGIALLHAADFSCFGPVVLDELAGLYQTRAMAFLKASRLAEGMKDVDRSVELRERLAQRFGQAPYALSLAGSYLDRGVIRRNMGDPAGAVEDYGRAIDLYSRYDPAGPIAPKDEGLAQAHMNRGVAYMALSKPEPALRDFEHAVTTFERMVEATEREDLIPNLAQAYNDRGIARRSRGDLAGALEDIDRSLQLREQLVKRRGMTNLVPDLAHAYANKALFLMGADQPARALEVAERAVDWLAPIAERQNSAGLRVDLARLRVMCGRARCETRQVARGLKEIALAIGEYEPLLCTGAADVLEGFVDALMAYTCPMSQRRTGTAPALSIGASLPRLREAVTAGARLPPHVIRKLQVLRRTLVPVLRRQNGDDGARLDATLQAIIEDSER